MEQTKLEKKIIDLVKEYFSRKRKERFVLGKTRIPLSIPSYDWEEACEAIWGGLSGKEVKRW